MNNNYNAVYLGSLGDYLCPYDGHIPAERSSNVEEGGDQKEIVLER